MTYSVLYKDIEDYLLSEKYSLINVRVSVGHLNLREYEKDGLIIQLGWDYIYFFRRSPCNPNDICFVARILKLHDLKSLIRICSQ